MTALPQDPFEAGGLKGFAERYRKGETTSEEVTRGAYLERIRILDPGLQAFEHVAEEQAINTARAMDSLLANGVDLGPLMGVPVAVKDLLAVDGMPATFGSRVDVGDIVGPEGSFVKNLKRCGAVILGKATCIEFAFGVLGVNRLRTPWNPWDAKTHRIPGGSSSGPAVAAAAGLCALAIGTDTGASVRLPAGLCGCFGLRTNAELWPTDGVFPIDANMDCIGPMTKSADDAAVAFAALAGVAVPEPAPFDGLRLGKPVGYFYDNLDEHVTRCMNAVLFELEKAGVEIVPIEVPEAAEREEYFPVALPAMVLGVLGRERFLKIRDDMDPLVAARCANGLEVKAAEFITLERRRAQLWRIADQRMQGLDGWVTPTMALVAPAVADFDDLDTAMTLTLAITQDAQPGSLFGQCGTSSPIHMYGSDLPVGLQVLCRRQDVAKAMSIALAIETVTGKPPLPDLSGFVR
jgi:aspartyl-tRNA(Asn)/glutamyl-tRNA(Gln) amidotransferase subunit A